MGVTPINRQNYMAEVENLLGLITDEEGMMLYGSYAYVYKKDWWDKIVEKEQEKEDEEED